MMNQGQRGVFTPVRNEPLTGRNANIQPTMFKRKQIFQKASTQRFQTPFSGYSFTGSSVTDNSFLARSQIFVQCNQENVIKLIKQELQKNGLNSMSETSEQSLKNKNELNILRIQIRSIKESYHELNKSFKRKLQEQEGTVNQLRKQLKGNNKSQSVNKEQISAQLVQKIKQVEQDIAIKMRLIFDKMQGDLRKELTNYANRQFVPTSFLDDLDKQLNELDDRIVNIQNQFESTKNTGNRENLLSASKIQKDSSVIFSSNSQLKLNKLERDLQYVKKVLDQKSQKIKELDELIVMGHQNQTRQIRQLKENVVQLASGLRETKKQSENSKQALQEKIQLYKKNMTEIMQSEIQNLGKQIYQQSLHKSQNLVNNNADPQSFIKKSQNTSILLENSGSEILTSSLKAEDTRQTSKLSQIDSSQEQKQSPKKAKKITITYGASEKSFSHHNQPVTGQQNNPIQNDVAQRALLSQAKQDKLLRKLYKVDKEGYLMDSDNKYILSGTNSMIFITEQQIASMEKTNLIKVEKWRDKK